MGASRENAKPSLLRRVLACLVSAAMVVAFTPVVAWGTTSSVEVGGLSISTTDSNGLIENQDYSCSCTSNGFPYFFITTAKPLTISGTTTTTHIVVAGNSYANITLNGVDIQVSGTAFSIREKATVNLTLVGNSTLKSSDSYDGLKVGSGQALLITSSSTGSLTATGGSAGGAGIGDSGGNNGGNVTISGGTVTATGGGWGAGIGADRFSTGTNGNALVFASSISDKSNQGSWSGVIFEGVANAKEASSISQTPHNPTVTINNDLTLDSGSGITIGSNAELVVSSSATLCNAGTIANNGTLTNNGTIINKGTIMGSGTITGNPPKTVVSTKYLDEHGAEQTCDTAIVVTANDTEWSGGTADNPVWYVVNSNVGIDSNRVKVSGNVNLILADGTTLEARYGIEVSDPNSLTVYGQQNGTGTLYTDKNSVMENGSSQILVGSTDLLD